MLMMLMMLKTLQDAARRCKTMPMILDKAADSNANGNAHADDDDDDDDDDDAAAVVPLPCCPCMPRPIRRSAAAAAG